MRPPFYAAAAAGTCFVLAGCGSTVKGVFSTASVAQAADRTASQKTAHADITVTSTSSTGDTQTVHGDGDFSNVKDLAEFHIRAHGHTIDEIATGDRVYLHSSLFKDEMPAGLSWMMIDLKEVLKDKGLSTDTLDQGSPQDSLNALRTGAVSVKKVGREVVSGLRAVHWRARVDLSKLSQGDKLAKLSKTRFVQYDVWVGPDSYVLRMAYTLTSGGTVTTTTLDLSNFGEKLDIQVPTPADTWDASYLGG